MDTNKFYYVYVIKSEKGKTYIGLSEDVDKRLEQHNNGLSKWTKRDRNWKIIYKEKLNNLSEARKRENYLKRQKGGNGFKNIVYS